MSSFNNVALKNPFDNVNSRVKRIKNKQAQNNANSIKTQKVKGGSNSIKNTSKSGGVKIVNKSNGKTQTIVLKTNYVKSGYNYKTNTATTNKEVGAHKASALKYIEREGASLDAKNEELSNVYNRIGERLDKEEFEELLSKSETLGSESFRRFEFSPGFNELDRDDLKDVVVAAVNNFLETTDKNVDVHFAVHTNTENIHAHIIMDGKKDAITMSKEQLQTFKVELAQQTANKLNDKELGLNLNFEKSLEREIKFLEDSKKLTAIQNDFKEIKQAIKNDFNKELIKEFQKQTQHIKLDSKELEQLTTLQKAKGAQDYALKNEDLEKFEKMKKWEESILQNVKPDTLKKFEDLDKALEDFKNSDKAQAIKKEFDEKLLDAAKQEAATIKEETIFKKAADNTVNKQKNENDKELSFSKEKAISIKKAAQTIQTPQQERGKSL